MSYNAPPTISGSVLVDTLGRNIPAPPNTFGYYSSGLVNGTATSDYTGCTGPLPIVAARLWTPPALNGGQTQFKFCYVNISVHTNLTGGPPSATQINATYELLQSLVLPNSTAWTFQYDNGNWGNLTQVTRPTGATISYTWSTP